MKVAESRGESISGNQPLQDTGGVEGPLTPPPHTGLPDVDSSSRTTDRLRDGFPHRAE